MKHGVLPPTANFEQPSSKIDLSASPFRVLKKAEQWPANNNQPRRAAISGFGFGGTNAHILLQEYEIKKSVKSVQTIKNTKLADIAIVGMDTCLGPWRDQQAFDSAFLFGDHQAMRHPNNWWGADSKAIRGYFVDEVKVPLGRYRIPPAELKEMLPQQLLMLEVAANALDDAGLTELSKEQQTRTGVFIGIALDLNTTNFHFRWMQEKYAREWLQRLGITLNNSELKE